MPPPGQSPFGTIKRTAKATKSAASVISSLSEGRVDTEGLLSLGLAVVPNPAPNAVKVLTGHYHPHGEFDAGFTYTSTVEETSRFGAGALRWGIKKGIVSGGETLTPLITGLEGTAGALGELTSSEVTWPWMVAGAADELNTWAKQHRPDTAEETQEKGLAGDENGFLDSAANGVNAVRTGYQATTNWISNSAAGRFYRNNIQVGHDDPVSDASGFMDSYNTLKQDVKHVLGFDHTDPPSSPQRMVSPGEGSIPPVFHTAIPEMCPTAATNSGSGSNPNGRSRRLLNHVMRSEMPAVLAEQASAQQPSAGTTDAQNWIRRSQTPIIPITIPATDPPNAAQMAKTAPPPATVKSRASSPVSRTGF